MDVTLMYSPGVGHAESDGRIEGWWQELVEGMRYSPQAFCQVGQDTMLMRARVALLEGEIDSLVIRYEGVDYRPDEYGIMPNEFNEKMKQVSGTHYALSLAQRMVKARSNVDRNLPG